MTPATGGAEDTTRPVRLFPAHSGGRRGLMTVAPEGPLHIAPPDHPEVREERSLRRRRPAAARRRTNSREDTGRAPAAMTSARRSSGTS
jgi:hypothetical protein